MLSSTCEKISIDYFVLNVCVCVFVLMGIGSMMQRGSLNTFVKYLWGYMRPSGSCKL